MAIKITLNEDQKKLVEENVALVSYAVKKYLKHVMMETDDMISIGYYGLCKAAFYYNSDFPYNFSSYAVKVIIRTIRRESQLAFRKKRGGGCTNISFDEVNFVNNADIESIALNRVMYAPVWKLVPIYRAIDKTGISGSQLAKNIGISKSTVSMRKEKELRKAKHYLEAHGITKAI